MPQTIKVTISDWACVCKKHLESLGYSHGQEIQLTESEIRELTFKFFDSGLNVMLRHCSDGSIMIATDTKAFTQR